MSLLNLNLRIWVQEAGGHGTSTSRITKHVALRPEDARSLSLLTCIPTAQSDAKCQAPKANVLDYTPDTHTHTPRHHLQFHFNSNPAPGGNLFISFSWKSKCPRSLIATANLLFLELFLLSFLLLASGCSSCSELSTPRNDEWNCCLTALYVSLMAIKAGQVEYGYHGGQQPPLGRNIVIVR